MNCTKKHSNNMETKGRELSLDEKKNLGYGDIVFIQGNCGCFLRVKVIGKPKTWKRQPEKVLVSWKYGMYEFGKFDENETVKIEIAG